MDVTPQLVRAVAGARARAAPAPSRARLAELGRAVADGSYSVRPELVARAFLAAAISRRDRPARPD